MLKNVEMTVPESRETREGIHFLDCGVHFDCVQLGYKVGLLWLHAALEGQQQSLWDCLALFLPHSLMDQVLYIEKGNIHLFQVCLFPLQYVVIESVDSICRDDTDTPII